MWPAGRLLPRSHFTVLNMRHAETETREQNMDQYHEKARPVCEGCSPCRKLGKLTPAWIIYQRGAAAVEILQGPRDRQQLLGACRAPFLLLEIYISFVTTALVSVLLK